MMRVIPQLPPASYENLVKRPGERFLLNNPNPSSSDFRRHAYWKSIHNNMYTLYNGICAYCASWTPRKIGDMNVDQTSIDHFLPKTSFPIYAYDWENFRLCRARLNNNKGNNLEIIDPFFVKVGWFVIDFTTFLILPGENLHVPLKNRISKSISIIGLNNNDYVEQRLDIIYRYSTDVITFWELQQLYPFIATEMNRQDFYTNYKEDIRGLKL